MGKDIKNIPKCEFVFIPTGHLLVLFIKFRAEVEKCNYISVDER